MTRLRSTIPRSPSPAGRTSPPPAAVVPAANPRTALARSRDGVAEDVFGGPVVTTGDDERAPAVSHELTDRDGARASHRRESLRLRHSPLRGIRLTRVTPVFLSWAVCTILLRRPRANFATKLPGIRAEHRDEALDDGGLAEHGAQ